jgi:hypothetical protein
MNGKSEGTGTKTCKHRWVDEIGPTGVIYRRCIECLTIEPKGSSGDGVSLDTRAICDKLDFLGRFVVAGIVKAISQNCPVFEEETGRARWDLERTDEEALAIADKLLAAMKEGK